MHWLLNFVAGPEGYPAGILIRGLLGLNGPARITKSLGLDGSLHGKPANRKTGLWLEYGEKVSDSMIVRSPRIGVSYAGPVWSKKKYRFSLKAPFIYKFQKL
jgi:DNA-3-methyladenine glycosylase